jgi:hypothetical protein
MAGWPQATKGTRMITRDNIDQLLNSGRIEAAMTTGKWWKIRRNGATKRWKKDPSRIRIPFKAGLYCYGAIDECNFLANGQLNPELFRVVS